MKLKERLKFSLLPLSVILLVLSYLQFVAGHQFSEQITKTEEEDIKLMQELSGVKGESKLDLIDKNIQTLNNLIGVLFDKFTIFDVDKETITPHVDKIGGFVDVIVTVKGDFWQQVYFLQQINKNMREFVIVDKLNGDNAQAVFNIRIYGRIN